MLYQPADLTKTGLGQRRQPDDTVRFVVASRAVASDPVGPYKMVERVAGPFVRPPQPLLASNDRSNLVLLSGTQVEIAYFFENLKPLLNIQP